MGDPPRQPEPTAFANDGAPAPESCGSAAVTVLSLMIFICVYRASRPLRPREICTVIDSWNEGATSRTDAERAIATMVAHGWLIGVDDCVKARARKGGRRPARR